MRRPGRPSPTAPGDRRTARAPTCRGRRAHRSTQLRAIERDPYRLARRPRFGRGQSDRKRGELRVGASLDLQDRDAVAMARQQALQRSAPRFDAVHGDGRRRAPATPAPCERRERPAALRAPRSSTAPASRTAMSERQRRGANRSAEARSEIGSSMAIRGSGGTLLRLRARRNDVHQARGERPPGREARSQSAPNSAADAHRDACSAGTSDNAPKSPRRQDRREPLAEAAQTKVVREAKPRRKRDARRLRIDLPRMHGQHGRQRPRR